MGGGGYRDSKGVKPGIWLTPDGSQGPCQVGASWGPPKYQGLQSGRTLKSLIDLIAQETLALVGKWPRK